MICLDLYVWVFVLFFLRICFVLNFKTWYFTGVTFCTASCILKNKKKKFLSILPWIVEYIVLYHHSPWGHSSVGLYKKLNPRPPTSSLFVKTFKAEFSFDEHCLWIDFRANPRRLYQVMKTMSLVLKLPTRCYRHVLTRKLTYIKQMKLRSCLKVVVVLFFS